MAGLRFSFSPSSFSEGPGSRDVLAHAGVARSSFFPPFSFSSFSSTLFEKAAKPQLQIRTASLFFFFLLSFSFFRLHYPSAGFAIGQT